MAMIVDRPPSADAQDSTPEAEGMKRASRAPQPARSWLDRYQQHLWIGGLSLLVVGALLAPIVLAPTAPKPAAVSSVSTSLATSVSITASEFKFSPNIIQVPVGQKISLTLNNSGSVEHDLTIPGAGFSLPARAGQSATGEFTFDKPGVFEFICSIPGHKDAGMKGTLTVVDPQAPVASAPIPAGSGVQAMAGMPGMAAAASSPDIKPLPADLKPLSAPQIAPPITRTEPAYVKFNLETTKVTAQMANGVAYEYWTFNNTVPGPMLRVREGDTVEIDLSNAADAGMTHSIDLHAVNGPGGGAKVMQIPRVRTVPSSSRRSPRRVCLPLRDADGGPAHRQRHVRPDRRRAQRRTAQSRPRVLPDAGRLLSPGPARRRGPARVRPEQDARRAARLTCSSTVASAR